MPDPIVEPTEVQVEALGRVMRTAEHYLALISQRPGAGQMPASVAAEGCIGPVDDGVGAIAAIEALAEAALLQATPSTGSRYFDFVIGGATPAAMAADWLTALVDQNAAGTGSSAWATELEAIVLEQLVDLFSLPRSWSGVLTASSMMASFTGLACATRWWARSHGVDYVEDGLSGLPRLAVFTGPLVHPTVRKALQMLGHGRQCVVEVGDVDADAIDLSDLDRRLGAHEGRAIVVATAGDASAGRFDPIADVASVAGGHGAWLHIDGAFGLYASLAERTRHLLEGIERADSIAADAHKWMNVPYESGFCLLRDPSGLEPTFGMPTATYLPAPDQGFRGFSVLGPESSRRARALPIWASVAAYGRAGLAGMVERHLDAAEHLGGRVAEEPDLELVIPPVSCVVCFRWSPPGRDPAGLDDANRRLASTLAHAGRFALGTTSVRGVVALRAALCNWRVQTPDVDELVAHVLQTAADLGR